MMSATDDIIGYDETDFKAYHRDGIWLTADYEEIPVAELETSHLMNIARSIIMASARWAKDQPDFEWWLSGQPFWPFAAAELNKRHVNAIKLVNNYLRQNNYTFRLEDE
jgi:lactate dehydrogenase-like 2-hydroxyacid dehydrogenase